MASLPWFLFFGRRYGMNREQVLGMRFGELQDLMACDAIFRGVAIEVVTKRKLSQEEMYELR